MPNSEVPKSTHCVEMGNIINKNKYDLAFIDFLSPLPRASMGMKNLICTDVFIKHVSLYATGQPTTTAVLNVVLNKYIPKYGPVKKILSDQGKQFTNRKWQSELEKHNIQTVLTACLLYTSQFCIYVPEL